jgi:hypothetical protein
MLTGFEPRQDQPWQGVAAIRGGRPGVNRKKFELDLLREKLAIPSTKATVENDDGHEWKNSRDNRTAIELFARELATWEGCAPRLIP